MDRTKVVLQIILCIKQLKEEANALFMAEDIVPNSSLKIEEFFQQKFNPYLEKVRHAIKGLPTDEYLAIEIDAWMRLLNAKLNTLEVNEYTGEYAEVLYIKQQFYPKLIDALRDLRLEVLETEFDARSDSPITAVNSMVELGPNTLVVSPAAVAALISLLYNFNVLALNTDIANLCKSFSDITGYKANDLSAYLSVEKESGRLKAKVGVEELKVLHKLLKSMISRTEFILSYTE